jgi:hypothetical protein
MNRKSLLKRSGATWQRQIESLISSPSALQPKKWRGWLTLQYMLIVSLSAFLIQLKDGVSSIALLLVCRRKECSVAVDSRGNARIVC